MDTIVIEDEHNPVCPSIVATKLLEQLHEQHRVLVLTRVMKDVEREFELSVEAIQYEAEELAIEQVKVFLPRDEPIRIPQKKGWFKKMIGWLGD